LKPGLHPAISVTERRKRMGACQQWIGRPPGGMIEADLALAGAFVHP